MSGTISGTDTSTTDNSSPSLVDQLTSLLTANGLPSTMVVADDGNTPPKSFSVATGSAQLGQEAQAHPELLPLGVSVGSDGTITIQASSIETADGTGLDIDPSTGKATQNGTLATLVNNLSAYAQSQQPSATVNTPATDPASQPDTSATQTLATTTLLPNRYGTNLTTAEASALQDSTNTVSTAFGAQAGIWKNTNGLNVENDFFLDAGGDATSANKMIAKLNAIPGVAKSGITFTAHDNGTVSFPVASLIDRDGKSTAILQALQDSTTHDALVNALTATTPVTPTPGMPASQMDGHLSAAVETISSAMGVPVKARQLLTGGTELFIDAGHNSAEAAAALANLNNIPAVKALNLTANSNDGTLSFTIPTTAKGELDMSKVMPLSEVRAQIQADLPDLAAPVGTVVAAVDKVTADIGVTTNSVASKLGLNNDAVKMMQNPSLGDIYNIGATSPEAAGIAAKALNKALGVTDIGVDDLTAGSIIIPKADLDKATVAQLADAKAAILLAVPDASKAAATQTTTLDVASQAILDRANAAKTAAIQLATLAGDTPDQIAKAGTDAYNNFGTPGFVDPSKQLADVNTITTKLGAYNDLLGRIPGAVSLQPDQVVNYTQFAANQDPESTAKLLKRIEDGIDQLSNSKAGDFDGKTRESQVAAMEATALLRHIQLVGSGAADSEVGSKNHALNYSATFDALEAHKGDKFDQIAAAIKSGKVTIKSSVDPLVAELNKDAGTMPTIGNFTTPVTPSGALTAKAPASKGKPVA